MLTREDLEQLSTAAIFKWVFLTSAVLCVPWSLLMGLLALFGFHTVSWRGRPVTGFLGLITGPFLGLFAAVILTVAIGGACIVAIRVFGTLAGPADETAEDTPVVDQDTAELSHGDPEAESPTSSQHTPDNL